MLLVHSCVYEYHKVEKNVETLLVDMNFCIEMETDPEVKRNKTSDKRNCFAKQ